MQLQLGKDRAVFVEDGRRISPVFLRTEEQPFGVGWWQEDSPEPVFFDALYYIVTREGE